MHYKMLCCLMHKLEEKIIKYITKTRNMSGNSDLSKIKGKKKVNSQQFMCMARFFKNKGPERNLQPKKIWWFLIKPSYGVFQKIK